MKKLIGYTKLSDIEEFEQDGFICVTIDPKNEFTEKVSFKESDIRFSPDTTLGMELDDFYERKIPIMINKFTKEGN